LLAILFLDLDVVAPHLSKECSSFKKLWDIEPSFSVAAPNDQITRLLLLMNLLSIEKEEVTGCCCY
jgi:hypothetical protein